MRNCGKAFLFLGIAALLCGCEAKKEEPWVPDQSAVQADEAGTLTETLVDTLDQSYYSSSELEQMIDRSIAEYNTDHGAGSIVKTSYTIENNKIRLVLQYKSYKDLASYNNEKFFNGSMLSAQMEGFLFDCNFRKVTDGVTSEKTIGADEPVSHKEYQVLVCNSLYTAEVPGKILYVSENAVTTAMRIATARTGTVDDGSEKEKLMYVIYEY